jgi:hypothetical protein
MAAISTIRQRIVLRSSILNFSHAEVILLIVRVSGPMIGPQNPNVNLPMIQLTIQAE